MQVFAIIVEWSAIGAAALVVGIAAAICVAGGGRG